MRKWERIGRGQIAEFGSRNAEVGKNRQRTGTGNYLPCVEFLFTLNAEPRAVNPEP